MGGGAVFINASEMCHTAPAKSASWVAHAELCVSLQARKINKKVCDFSVEGGGRGGRGGERRLPRPGRQEGAGSGRHQRRELPQRY